MMNLLGQRRTPVDQIGAFFGHGDAETFPGGELPVSIFNFDIL